MVRIGEISLYISRVGLAIGALTSVVNSSVSFLVLASSLLSVPLIKNHLLIYRFFNSLIPRSLKKMGKNISTEIGIIRSEFEPSGSFFDLLGRKVKDMFINLIFILLPVPFILFAVDNLGFSVFLLGLAYAIFIS